VGTYLGLDSSTQSLSATIIDTDSGELVAEQAVNFGQDLPQYGSPSGVLPAEDPALCHSNPLMWVEALDLIFGRLRERGVDLGRIDGISGAGQQHGSVYLARPVDEVGGWSAERPLKEQVAPLLSRPTSPIWMDSSTTAECREIAAAVGGDARVVAVTGSRATERFTGPQIRKLYRTEPKVYAETREIHLVSSFIAALLTARSVPIDLGDGAGMNLLELATAKWSPELLDATAPELSARLRDPVASSTQVGEIAEYFVTRYGLRRGIGVFAFTGDNPSSLVGMGAAAPGTAVISLGTSDTVFAAMREPRTDPRGFGHVFGNPAGGFMSLICFANGSLAREAIAKRFGLDWDAFSAAITERTVPGNRGNLLLPFFVPEITPRVGEPNVKLFGTEEFVAYGDAAATVRAIVEAQALSMRRHSDWIGERPERILVTGGASRSPGIRRVLADVFQAEITPLSVSNSSALGGALRAAQATEGTAYAKLFSSFSVPDTAHTTVPNPSTRPVYDEHLGRFVEKLETVLGTPEPHSHS
jgi:xylulokinase